MISIKLGIFVYLGLMLFFSVALRFVASWNKITFYLRISVIILAVITLDGF